MSFKRYLAVMGVTAVTAAALVAGFNLLVDPLGISPIRIAIAGFNEWKPLRQDYDRIVKPSGVIIRNDFHWLVANQASHRSQVARGHSVCPSLQCGDQW